MDDLDQLVMSVVITDDRVARAWFESLHRAVTARRSAGTHDPAAVLTALEADGQPPGTVRELADVLARTDAGRMLARVADVDAAQLTERWRRGPDTAAPSPAPAEDPDGWNAFLRDHGSRWDGTEESWRVFRDWFAHEGAAAGVGTFTQGFLAGAEASGDKPGYFVRYGVPVPTRAEDPAAWNAFLRENGPRWDGTEEGWPGFRDWFAYHGATARVGTSAERFLAGAEASGDGAGFFARYGVTVPSTPAEPVAAAGTDGAGAGTDGAAAGTDPERPGPGADAGGPDFSGITEDRMNAALDAALEALARLP